jgi:flagellum-specific peptidoglycan hydrolase FlgJ
MGKKDISLNILFKIGKNYNMNEVIVSQKKSPVIKVTGIKVVPFALLVLGFFVIVICSSAYYIKNNPVIIERKITVRDTVIMTKEKIKIKREKVYTNLDATINSIKSGMKLTTSGKSVAITDLVTNDRVLNFITHNEVLSRAYKISQITGINVSVLIAQKGLESAWGESKFTKTTKCLGNIKCFNKACKKRNKKGLKHKQMGDIGPHCVQLYDDNPHDRFVRFATYQEGWNHYLALIEKRYSKAGQRETSKEQIQVIKNLGYATDKKYPAKVMSIIKQYGLDKLDKAIGQGNTITTQTGQYVLLKK